MTKSAGAFFSVLPKLFHTYFLSHKLRFLVFLLFSQWIQMHSYPLGPFDKDYPCSDGVKKTGRKARLCSLLMGFAYRAELIFPVAILEINRAASVHFHALQLGVESPQGNGLPQGDDHALIVQIRAQLFTLAVTVVGVQNSEQMLNRLIHMGICKTRSVGAIAASMPKCSFRLA